MLKRLDLRAGIEIASEPAVRGAMLGWIVVAAVLLGMSLARGL